MHAELLAAARCGKYDWVHWGLPCKTWCLQARGAGTRRALARPRSHQRGPPAPTGGRDGLEPTEDEKLANRQCEEMCELARAVLASGGHVSIENPWQSVLWQAPPLLEVCADWQMYSVRLDLCAYGLKFQNLPIMKPTVLLSSAPELRTLEKTCVCEPIVPKGPKHGNCTVRSGEYPPELCEAFAKAVLAAAELWSTPEKRRANGPRRRPAGLDDPAEKDLQNSRKALLQALSVP